MEPEDSHRDAPEAEAHESYDGRYRYAQQGAEKATVRGWRRYLLLGVCFHRS
jgi:hypothetical protein